MSFEIIGTKHLGPGTRTVDQFAGNPSKWWEANAAADERIAGLARLRDENASLRAERSELYRQLEQRFQGASRVDELEDELVAARESLEVWKQRALAKVEDWHGRAATT